MHQAVELLTVFGAGAGNAFIGIDSGEIPVWIFLYQMSVVVHLHRQRVQLILGITADTGIGRHAKALRLLLYWLDDLDLRHTISSEFDAVTFFLSHTTYPKGRSKAIHENH